MKTYKEFLTERKPLNVAQRKAMARRMSRMMKSSAMKNKIAKAKKRHATPDKLWKRAQKQAKMLIIKKAGYKEYSSLPPVKKMEIDKVLQKKYAKIPAIAKKLVIKLKKAETERMRSQLEK
jgi:hypothetical protein|tara:strand:+ start:870 stop:1232 length:363 start_codon:yes stop_codon:yes gene_type:complete